MKDKKLKKELEKKLNSDISLPDSLSEKSIEKLINEKGKIVNIRAHKANHAKTAMKVIAAIAASFVLIFGAGFAVKTVDNTIKVNKIDKITENVLSKNDYTAIETAVVNRLSEMYKENIVNNSVYDMLYKGSDLKDSADSISGIPSANAVNEDQASVPHSETNLQVEGVDEGDIIKTDGEYIYYVKDNYVIVADINDPSDIKLSKRMKNENYIHEIFLYNDRLVIIYSVEKPISTESGINTNYKVCDCIYPYSEDTMIKIYDVKDKKSFSEEYSLKLSGYYVSGRITDGKLITVTNYFIPYSMACAYDNFEDGAKAIQKVSVPVYSLNGGEETRIPQTNIRFTDDNDIEEYAVMCMTDLNELSSEPKTAASLGSGYNIYCNAEHLYTTRHKYISEQAGSFVTSSCEKVVIDKYDITNEGVKYTATGEVEGSPLNQFSMDEYNGYFRIATNQWTYNESTGSTGENIVTVFDKDMKKVGELKGIAPNESIQSARFLGDTLYLVTFYQTDPLFVIDLSDPTAPTISGELKIPGFSSYLHPVGNGLVIGVGTGGNAQGADGSAKISLFDVSDPKAPKEIDNYTLAQAYFNTEHKAFTVIDKNTFAIPVTKQIPDQRQGWLEEYSIMVISIENNSITVKNAYKHTLGDISYSSTMRGVFSGNTLFAVNYNGITAYDMTTGKEVGTLRF